MTDIKQKVEIYTDGSCRGNPSGPGGYGCILRYKDSKNIVHERELSCGYISTTNNRMELMAVIIGLEALNKPCRVDLYSDSQYVTNAFTKGWLNNWKANNWKKSDKKPVLNKDLWMRLSNIIMVHDVKFNWVRGHEGHDENERCDRLATHASGQSLEDMIEDEGYIQEKCSS